MSFTFDPYKTRSSEVSSAQDVLMTNPTAFCELENYWASLPRSCGVPMRKDVDPRAIGDLLEDSFILERVAPGVARIRVAGRNIGKLLGIEPRGLPLTATFLPASRTALSRHLESVFMSPALVELGLDAPRAVGQPTLQGRLLMLPLRDDHGHVSRMLGLLAMSGRRGLGGRRFMISQTSPMRFEPIIGSEQVFGGKPVAQNPSLRVYSGTHTQKAKDTPALRLVVSNA